MDEIKRQVKRAQWRLNFNQFLTMVSWSMFASLLVGVIGLAIPKIWVLQIDAVVWQWSWIAGSAAVGLIVASVWTYLARRSAIEAAIELDRRFGLRERVSSTLSLAPQELDSEVGRALVNDASRRVERIDVRDQFKVQPSWRLVLPVVSAIAIVGITLLPNAALKQATASTTPPTESQKVVKAAAEKLKQKLRDTQKKAEELGLKDAELLKQIDREVDKLTAKDGLDRKDAMIKINDLAKEVQKKKEGLAGADEMRKNLEKLKDVQKGPADKTADALKNGDFGKAKEELEKLQQDLKDGKLSQEKKEELAKQLEQLSEKLKGMADEHKEARENLAKDIEKKMQSGDPKQMAEASDLQEKLDKMDTQAAQMEKMNERMSEKLAECAKCMKSGSKEGEKQALDELGDLAESLDELQEQLDQLENLDEVMDQLASAKGAMRGKDGMEGEGMEGEGEGQGKGKGNQPGKGMGEGQGEGERPEEETDKNFYDSRVAADPKKGESIRIGDAGGKNIAGVTREGLKEEVTAGRAKDPDALNDVTLPREQRDHARQYFERFRTGE